MLQRKLRPSTELVNVQLDPRHAASKHITAPINRTRPSPLKLSFQQMAPPVRGNTHPITAYYSVYRSRKDERLSRPGRLVTYRNKVPPPGVEPVHVTHSSTNRARRRVTSLIRPTPLPLRHAGGGGQYSCRTSFTSDNTLRRYGHLSISEYGGRSPSWIFKSCKC